MTIMVRSFIISNERRTRRMVTIIKTRQRDNDIIVSHGHMNRRYYHERRAEKLHIL